MIVSLVLLLFVITGCSVIGFGLHSMFTIYDEIDTETTDLFKSIETTCDTLAENSYLSMDSFTERILKNAEVSAYFAGFLEAGEEEGDDITGPFQKGDIIRLENGNVITNGNLPFHTEGFADSLNKNKGTFETYFLNEDGEEELAFVSFVLIRDNYYYCEMHSYDEYLLYVQTHKNIQESFSNLEQIYDTRMIVAFNGEDDDPIDEYYTIYYQTPSLIQDSYIVECETIKDLKALDQYASENGIISMHEFDNGRMFALVELPLKNNVFDLIQKYSIQYGIIIMLATVFIVWVIAVYRFVFDHKLTDMQKEQYNPKRVRRSARVIVIVCTLCVFLISMFIHAAISLQRAGESSARALELLKYQNSVSEINADNTNRSNNLFYTDLTYRLENFFAEHPDRLTHDVLDRCAYYSDLEFITYYDSSGNEISSSNDLVNLSLSNNGDNTTAVFKPILNGVDSVYAGNVKEPYYANEQDIYGSRTTLADGRYGVILFGLTDQDNPLDQEDETNKMLQAMTPSESLTFQVDKELKCVFHSSDPDLQYTDTEALNIKLDKIVEGNGNFYKINNINYYGLASVDEHSIWFYLTKSSFIFKKIINEGLNGAILCLISLVILYIYLLHGYNDEEFARHCNTGDLIVRRNDLSYSQELLTSDAKNEARTMMYTPLKWNERMPDQKAKFVFQVFSIILLLIIGFIVARSSSQGGNIFNFLIYGNWTRGFNMFAYSSIVIMGLLVFAGISGIKMIISMLMNLMSIRTATIARLMMHFLRYVAITVFIYYTAEYLGLNPGTVLASASLIAFTVSLGSKDIVTDMVAGIMLVFERDFQVGDIIEVGNYRGTVLEIGVRTTKLIGEGNNIKSIPNKDIKNVINRTTMNSWYIMTVSIPSSCDLAEIEKMFAEELPKIGSRIPEIINDPIYKGVTNIQGGKMTITIIAEYNEKDFHEVQRKLNEEIINVLHEHDIPIS